MSSIQPRYSILCVDDEAILLDLTRLFLERRGDFSVDTALSGQEGLDKLQAGSYDAMVVDYEMPGMNGIELLKTVRKSGDTIPFIIFTGRGREEIVIEAIENGADFYLQKGGEPSSQFAELSSKLIHAIQSRHAEDALHKEREQLFSIFDSLDMLIYVVDPETNEILYVNNTFKQILNRDVIGGKCYEEFQGLPSRCSFCTNDIILNQKPAPYRWEFYNHALNRYFDIIDRIIRWPDGREVRLEVATDITDRKRGEEELLAAYEQISASEEELSEQYEKLAHNQEELKESEERYRGVIENIQDVFFRSDLKGNLVMVSPSALSLFGYDSLEEILDKNFRSSLLINPDDWERFLYALEKEGAVYNYEVVLKRKDESSVYVSINGHYIYSYESVSGIEGTIRDISSLKKVTAAFRESEEKYRILVENSQDGVFILQDEKVAFCNSSFARIVGYSRDEIIGMPFGDLIHPDERDEIMKRYRNWIEGGNEPNSYDLRMVHKDPSVQVQAHLFIDIGVFQGRTAGIGTIRDITREREQEAILRQSREQLTEIAMSIPGVVYQFVAKSDGYMGTTYVSPRSMEYLGIPSDSESFFDLFSQFVHPDDRESFLASIHQAVAEKGSWKYEGRFLKGCDIIWFKGISSPIIHGEDIFYGGVLFDITQEKHVEEDLYEIRTTLQAILDDSPIPQFVIGTDHKVIFWNRALEKYSGIRAEEVIGTLNQWRAFYLESRPCLADLMLEGISSISEWYADKYAPSRLVENAYEATDFFPNMGESGKWLFFTAALIRNNAGVIMGAVETLEDITDQKKFEEGIVQKNLKLNLLADITRHDILNTLTVLFGTIDLIRDEVTTPKLIELIEMAQNTSDMVFRQISFTRDYQQIGVNAPLWQDLWELFEDMEKSGLPTGLELHYPSFDLEIFADALFGRVFSNLITNVSMHGKTATRIDISYWIQDDDLILLFEDNGEGIPDEIKEKIFERGFGSHTGYGLFLSREILGITGISIREIGVYGEGARFEIMVPSGNFRKKDIKS